MREEEYKEQINKRTESQVRPPHIGCLGQAFGGISVCVRASFYHKYVHEVINRRDGESERAVWTADKVSPLILKENVFGSQSYVTASLFLFYLVDEPFLINNQIVFRCCAIRGFLRNHLVKDCGFLP